MSTGPSSTTGRRTNLTRTRDSGRTRQCPLSPVSSTGIYLSRGRGSEGTVVLPDAKTRDPRPTSSGTAVGVAREWFPPLHLPVQAHPCGRGLPLRHVPREVPQGDAGPVLADVGLRRHNEGSLASEVPPSSRSPSIPTGFATLPVPRGPGLTGRAQTYPSQGGRPRLDPAPPPPPRRLGATRRCRRWVPRSSCHAGGAHRAGVVARGPTFTVRVLFRVRPHG